MDNFIKYKNDYIKHNIFLEDTFLDFNLKFRNLTDKELSELFWLWEVPKYNNNKKQIYIDEMILRLGEDSANKIIIVDRLSFTIYNKYELINREIKNRWLSKQN